MWSHLLRAPEEVAHRVEGDECEDDEHDEHGEEGADGAGRPVLSTHPVGVQGRLLRRKTELVPPGEMSAGKISMYSMVGVSRK